MKHLSAVEFFTVIQCNLRLDQSKGLLKPFEMYQHLYYCHKTVNEIKVFQVWTNSYGKDRDMKRSHIR